MDFPHALISVLMATGTATLIPRTLALMAVQRHTAASMSANPCSTAQHLLEGGVPATMLTSPPRRSAHTPNFSVSLGQNGFAGGALLGVFGFGFGVGVGLHGSQAAENVKKRRRERTTMAAAESLLEAMASY